MKDLKRKQQPRKQGKTTLRLIFKRLQTLVSYIFYTKYKRGSATGSPAISKCGTPTEKISEFLDHNLQPIMKEGRSYIKDTAGFLDKLKI